MHTHLHTHAYIHMHTHMQIYTHACMQMHINAHKCTHMHSCAHTYTNARTCTHTSTLTCTHAHTHTHTIYLQFVLDQLWHFHPVDVNPLILAVFLVPPPPQSVFLTTFLLPFDPVVTPEHTWLISPVIRTFMQLWVLHWCQKINWVIWLQFQMLFLQMLRYGTI